MLLVNKADPNQEYLGASILTQVLLRSEDEFRSIDLPTKKTMIQLLLKHKADPNMYHNIFQPPLMLAVSQGEREIIKLLIENKANINHIHSEKWSIRTPLQEAIFHGQHAALSTLLELKADIYLEEKYLAHPLVFAITNG